MTTLLFSRSTARQVMMVMLVVVMMLVVMMMVVIMMVAVMMVVMLVIMMLVVVMKIVMRKVRKQPPDVILLVKSNQGLGLTQLLPATEK